MRPVHALLASVALIATANTPPETPPTTPGAPTVDAAPPVPAPPAARRPRYPGFAPWLAQQPLPAPGRGQTLTADKAWRKLATSTATNRQLARWNLAQSLLHTGAGADAFGVLTVMREDDPDLALVPAWQLAMGVALALLDRPLDALRQLTASQLGGDAEACAWRMRMLAASAMAQDAIDEWPCAQPAIAARPGKDRVPFLIAAATAALEAGQHGRALTLLTTLGDRDSGANLVRGRALLAEGKHQEGRLRLQRVGVSGNPAQQAAAELALIADGVAARDLAPAAAIKRLDLLTYRWRGDAVEREALMLRWRLAESAGDPQSELRTAATLFRHFDLGAAATPTLERARARLGALIAPEGGLSVADAAGLYWEYRDLTPTGGEGDRLAYQLSERLASVGLFERAAELLQYQIDNRAIDIAKGPLSARVAGLHLMAGRPDLALKTLRGTDGPPYPQTMLDERRRMEAIALFRLGKTAEALGLLEMLPDGAQLRAEMLWRARDWKQFREANGQSLPRAGGLTQVAQTQILRQAIAMAMQGDDAGLSGMRRRYSAAFKGLPSAPAFAMLTDGTTQLTPERIASAMGGLPGDAPLDESMLLLDGDGKPAA